MTNRRIRLPDPLKEMLLSCEGTCVIECCGVDAMDYSERRLSLWLMDQPLDRRTQAVGQLRGIVKDVESQPEAEVSSDELNSTWRKAEAAAFFAGILATVEKATKALFPFEAAP